MVRARWFIVLPFVFLTAIFASSLPCKLWVSTKNIKFIHGVAVCVCEYFFAYSAFEPVVRFDVSPAKVFIAAVAVKPYFTVLCFWCLVFA